ncbi:hypothetical protein BST81_12220 [Leptolyngbya sp. 'hensonii']|uniref:hybrid sensor histidine kinase/response regulator n=1 Tax=Leptolyngbya sp. 'hensonii' TaxID=1922337 RepID=UPI00094FF687|nr:hybrid sensor histidine kinase/response regulator [Leptolyngbya sp. 'hensonii']OLP17825.1 hypothetical protein BST81_12220 [Leptolyngbya sp. 'hensonii']
MDKEQEIRQQFLEEAREYLGTIEAAFMDLSGLSTHSAMDAVLRAVHSIKGGAAMMGFDRLSQLAHRFEDFFKVIKARRESLVLDSELEGLLLQGVDCLNQVLTLHQRGQPIAESWLHAQTHTLFESLHDRLGDLQAEDETVLLLEEGNHEEIVTLLFETEVEASLQRLEALLMEPGLPGIREELEGVCQELGGLGEMLELYPFVRLCQTIEGMLQAMPDSASLVARSALQSWRQAQALILAGEVDRLPMTLDLAESDSAAKARPNPQHSVAVLVGQGHSAIPDAAPLLPLVDINDSHAWLDCDLLDYYFLSEDQPVKSVEVAPPPPDQTLPRKAAPSEPASVAGGAGDGALPNRFDPLENTVRVGVRQLDQLNDLFGELTIERNGLDLHLGRLRHLVSTLSYRIQALERSNSQLRTVYDQLTTQSNQQPAQSWNWLAVTPTLMLTSGSQDLPWKEMGSRFDSLELDRYNNLHLLSQEVMETIVQVQEITSDIEVSLKDADHTTRDLNRTAKQMQISLTQVRMRPLSDILNRFPRALREMCLQYGKQVNLQVVGGSTLIDRTILEALSDPLMHLLRNAFDHGIEDPLIRQAYDKSEQGTIEIRAAYRGNQTVIILRDDGGGIDPEKIRAKAQQGGYDEKFLESLSDAELLALIFEPGFSTADRVTALSGRGIGMDVVRTNLRKVRGEIKVDTQLGVGTTFTITVPFTLSVMRVLMVESRGMLMALPKDEIEEVLLLNPAAVFTTAGAEVLQWEDLMFPLIRLGHCLEFHCPQRPLETEAVPLISEPLILLLNWGSTLVAVQVDRCWGEQEVAIRQVEGTIALPLGFAGCSILGNGRVVPLLDIPTLLEQIMADQSRSLRQTGKVTDVPEGAAIAQSQLDTVLVVDDSIVVRRYLAMILEKAGYRVEQARDGQDALEKLWNGLTVRAVVCDIEMPRLDGYGFLNRIKAESTLRDLPVAILTSRSGNKHRQLAMNLGAAAYFSKPFREQDLLETLNQLIHT